VTFKCPKCKTENPDDSKFCRECGATLIRLKDVSVTKTLQAPTKGFKKDTVIAKKYKIIEKLGEGGMGVVYKAKDTRLDRTVALKFLPPELTKDEEAKKRFIQEAKAAAALNHPHICTIYEIDEAEEQTFISMEYIEGQSLKDKLKDGPLSIDEAKDTALQVATGLEKAHKKGIVHRDIKPANIMINDEGQAKITDFGLAKLSWGVDLTKPSTIMGTVAYMSPEQARGEEVDHRTDIWSLGAMLYEMLTGTRPFKKDKEPALIYSILNDEPRPIVSLRSEIPSHILHLIKKALTKKAAERHQNVGEIIQDLKQSTPIVFPKTDKSIVVLPFDDMSPNKDNEYFSDGLTEEIISDLSMIHNLLVISRSSAMTYKGTKKKIKEIGQELNVQYVLEGSVRKAGNNLRITAQLIDAENDVHLWAEKYNGTLEDVFDIQEEVSQSIVNALKIRLTSKEKKKMTARPIDNASAYDCYLRAYREIMSFSKDRLEHALKLLHNGIEIIGENAVFYAGIAFTHFQYANLGIEQEKHIEKAEEFLTKAFNLESELAEAYLVSGWINQVFHGNAHKAMAQFQRAHSIKPEDPEIMTSLGWGYVLVGRMDTAMSLADRTIKIDPINPMNYSMKEGILHFFQGQFNLAIKPLLDMYKLLPESSMWQFWKALVLLYNDRPKESFDFINKCVKEPGQDALAQMAIFLKYVLKGNRDKLSDLLTPDYIKAAQRDCQFSWHMASFYSYLDDKDRSLDWLENAVDRGFINYPFLNEHDKLLDNIRGEPRFKKLMERVKREWENFEV
jgi:serine/threonine protein kinase/lipoprotein NlpI